MANPNPNTDHMLESRWRAGESGNPAGKPKGAKHLSTWIRELMEDEDFGRKIKGKTSINGAPVKAIVGTLILKAIEGDLKAFDLLGKYGWGTRLDVTSDYRSIPTPILSGLVVIRDSSAYLEEESL